MKKRKNCLFYVFGIVVLLLLASISAQGIVIKNVKTNKVINKELKILKTNNLAIYNHKTIDRKNFNKNIFSNNFGGWIYTRCNGVEKRTSILRGLLLPIDVDNNSNTGINGNDIQVKFYIYPWIEIDNVGIVLVFITTLRVERLGDEIKNSDFEIYLEILLPDLISSSLSHRLRIGYYSPENEEIPKIADGTMKFKPYFIYGKKPEFTFGITPSFDSTEDQIIVLVSDYAKFEDSNMVVHRVFSIEYNPAVIATVKIIPGTSEDMWGYTFTRSAEKDTTVTFSYEIEKSDDVSRSITLNIDKLPELLSFELGLTPFSSGGGKLKYRSSKEYNITLSITGSRLGICKYFIIKYIPREVDATWLPKLIGGYLSLHISSSRSEIIIKDKEYEPKIRFSFTNLSKMINATWEFNNETGYFELTSDQPGTIMSLNWKVDGFDIEISTELDTSYFFTSWSISMPGYLELDCNGEYLVSYQFKIEFDSIFGIIMRADLLQAEDYRIEWESLLPPIINTSGDLKIIGNIDLGIMLGGTWYWIL
jgi:hypothetical protein